MKETDFWDRQVENRAYGVKEVIIPKDQEFSPDHRFSLKLLGDLRGKRLLVAGCGEGTEAVILARKGAIVAVFDISTKSIEMVKERAKANRVRIEASVKPFEHLDYESESFDLAYGNCILHHVGDISKAGQELYRVLRKGAKAVFFENSSRNTILMFARKRLVGKFRIPKYGSEKEAPLRREEVEQIGRIFDNYKVYYPCFRFFYLLDRYLFDFNNRKVSFLVNKLDNFIYKAFPLLRKYSYWQVIELIKED